MRKAFFDKVKKKHKPLNKPKLGLALQGGGAYGSFTKGALIALLEDGIITPDNLKAATGTSAGAKNATLLVDGLTSGTPESTIEKLNQYWHDVGQTFKSSLSSPFPLVDFFIPTAFTEDTYPNLTDSFQRAAANMPIPNGYMHRQLQKLLENNISDWPALQNSPIKLFVNAVKEDPDTGERTHHVFTGEELSPATVPLSANLQEFGPAAHEGAHYYDGAYWRNPCFDGVLGAGITDLLVINIQPSPVGAITPVNQDEARNNRGKPGYEIMGAEIHNHMPWLQKNHPDVRFHEIKLDVAPHWDDSSRVNAHPLWLDDLSGMGYKAAKQWIADNAHLLGKASSYKTESNASNDNKKTAGRKPEFATG